SCSMGAGSIIAATWSSRDVPYARRRSGAPSIPTASFPTSACTRRSAFLPGPAVRVAHGDFSHHRGERLVEIDTLRIRETDHHEQNVGQLHRDRAGILFDLLGLLPEPMIDLSRELSHLFGQAREVRQRREVSFFILRDPLINRLLRFAEGHGESP